MRTAAAVTIAAKIVPLRVAAMAAAVTTVLKPAAEKTVVLVE